MGNGYNSRLETVHAKKAQKCIDKKVKNKYNRTEN